MSQIFIFYFIHFSTAEISRNIKAKNLLFPTVKEAKGLWCNLGPDVSYANITSKGHPKVRQFPAGYLTLPLPRLQRQASDSYPGQSDGIFQHLEQGSFTSIHKKKKECFN